MFDQLKFILPDWPAPDRVQAVATTRLGGVSDPPFDCFNLADHVGDDPAHVIQNRRLLKQVLNLPAEPVWLRQVHGTRVTDTAEVTEQEADGNVSSRPGVVCAVLTADCLPVFLCDRDGQQVGVLHVGWRGLAAGIIEQGVRAMRAPPADLLAWLGPAIGPGAFEVGAEVRTTFVGQDVATTDAFKPAGDRWLADVYTLARRCLERAGVEGVFGGGRCTMTEAGLFFSYRRERRCGRMASLIWLDDGNADIV